MKLTFALLWKEIKRNKFKVIVAVVISLILYMCAFTLCNVASALPANFYTYYEELNPELISVNVRNADQALYENNQFIATEVDWRIVYDEYAVSYEGKTFDFYQEDIEGNQTQIYDTIFVEDLIKSAEGIDIPGILPGYAKENNMGVWLGKVSANAIGASKGDVITYDYHNAQVPVTVRGVYDETKLAKYLYQEYGISDLPYMLIMTEAQGRDIIFQSGKHFGMVGYLDKVDSVFDVQVALKDKYDVDATTVFDMVEKVKNSEIICGIMGGIMLVGGVVILLNFMNMFMSSNTKNIGLLRMLGAKTKYIMWAYYLIFLIIITVVCFVSWAVLPLYNLIVVWYCNLLGYQFVIDINYGLVAGMFALSYILITALMGVKYWLVSRTTPNQMIGEED